MNIIQSDRQAVEKIMGVKIPEYPEGRSWDDLISLRSDLRSASKNLLGRAKKEERDLTEDEERASDAACEILQGISDEIETRTIENRKGPRLMDEPLRPFASTQRRNEMTDIFAPKKTWRSLFGREPKPFEGTKNFGEAIIALHRGDTEKIRELRTLNTITGSEGGFSAPERWWAQVYDSGVEASVALDKVTNFPMTDGNTLYVPAWDSADKSGGPIGCVEGQWLGETQTATRVTPNLRLVKFNAYKLAMFIAASSEVLQDSSALAQSIAPLMKNSLAFSLDEAILTGDGNGRPMGVLNSPATIAQTRASATDITFADLVAMKGRMLPSSLSKAIFIVSPSAFSVLCGLVITAGTGELVMGYQHGASDMRMSILGHPVRVTEKLPALGEKGDIGLYDLSYYGLAMREVARFERTNSAQWTEDIVDMRFVLRCDGKPLIAAPFTPAGGGNSLSPFVVLE